MKKYFESAFFLLIAIGVWVILLSCMLNSEKKQVRVESGPAQLFKNKIDSVSSSENDTLQFEKLIDIINYYYKPMISFERLKSQAYKFKNSGGDISPDSIQRIDSLYFDIIEQRSIAIYKYIATHKKDSESFRGLIYLIIDRKTPAAAIDSLFKLYPISLQKSAGGKLYNGKIKERLRSELQFNYNISILNAKLKTLQGEMISLNEIGSKYLLLDFWSSWCGPCRYENRAMIKEKDLITKSADISIVAISLDTNKDKWLKACNEDQLNYLSVCDFKELQSPLVKELRVQKIPHMVLITKDGKILARNLSNDKLIEFIKGLP